MTIHSVVLPFPKKKKRGRKVSRGPAAKVVELPQLAETKEFLGAYHERIRALISEMIEGSPDKACADVVRLLKAHRSQHIKSFEPGS